MATIQSGPERRRARRWLPSIALGSGLFTIALSLSMLYVFSRYASDHRVAAHTDHQEPSTSPTTTHVDNFTPIPTPTPTPVILPDPAQETGFVLNPQDHNARAPKTLRITWNVTRELRQPDGVEKQIYLINGAQHDSLAPAQPNLTV